MALFPVLCTLQYYLLSTYILSTNLLVYLLTSHISRLLSLLCPSVLLALNDLRLRALADRLA